MNRVNIVAGNSGVEGKLVKYKTIKLLERLLRKLMGNPQKVPGAIWTVARVDEKQLDTYEGFPFFYYEKEFVLNVKTPNEIWENLKCFVYIMHEDRLLGIPTKRYVETCRQEYIDFSLDQKFLDDALLDTARNKKE